MSYSILRTTFSSAFGIFPILNALHCTLVRFFLVLCALHLATIGGVSICLCTRKKLESIVTIYVQLLSSSFACSLFFPLRRCITISNKYLKHHRLLHVCLPSGKTGKSIPFHTLSHVFSDRPVGGQHCSLASPLSQKDNPKRMAGKSKARCVSSRLLTPSTMTNT